MTPAAPLDRPPPLWQRHDLVVVLVALALLTAGGLLYRRLTTPSLTTFSDHGLRLSRPASMLPPRPVEPPSSALGALEGGFAGAEGGRPEGLPLHLMFQATDDPRSRLEIMVDVRPDYRGLPMWLRLSRHTRYGEFYWTDASEPREVAGQGWQRTRFKYAFKATEDDAPQVATGIEYATLNGSLLYVVTMHGTQAGAARLESLVAGSLRIDAAAGGPL